MSAAKIWFIVGACLVVLGALVFVIAMSVSGWDITKISTSDFQTKTYDLDGEIRDIIIKTDTPDIELLPAEGNSCRVICYENKTLTHEVNVADGVLKVELNDQRAWYEYISIGFTSPKITVFLPIAEYGELKINGSTGDVYVSDSFKFKSTDIAASTASVDFRSDVDGKLQIGLSTGGVRLSGVNVGSLAITLSTGDANIRSTACVGDMKINVTTGDVYVFDTSCGSFTSNGDTGDIDMKGLIAAGELSLVRSTGDVEFERCDAAQIKISTTTGGVDGSLLSEKVFIAKTSTGDIEVPRSTSGGLCKISTSTGDIEIEITR